jgi:hypothetical protein
VQVYIHRDVLAEVGAAGRIGFNFGMLGKCWITVGSTSA